MLPDDHLRVARLMRRVWEENKRAEWQLVMRHQPSVTRLARWWLNRNPDLRRFEDFDDIAQEVWRRYYQALREARWTHTDSVHVATLLALLVRDVVREQAQYYHRLCRDIDCTQPLSASSEAVDPQAQPDELIASLDLVERALDMLEAPDRRIVEARMTDCRWAEIAEQSGLTAEAARKRFKRAMETIRRAFRSEDERCRGGGGGVACTDSSTCEALRFVCGTSPPPGSRNS